MRLLQKITMLMAMSQFVTMSLLADVGTAGGWQTDTDGSVTGTVGTRFIWVNEANFPDAKFRNHILTSTATGTGTSFDNIAGYGKDGILTEEEVDAITMIGTSSSGISSIQGVEYFTNLEILRCGGNSIASLDVTKNTALTQLMCWGNKLTELDITKNTLLKQLQCNDNQLSTLDLTQNTQLEMIHCYNNPLGTLDVSQNVAVTNLLCYNTGITELDVSNNLSLDYLNCQDNLLTSLDVSSNAQLATLNCYKNQIERLDLTANTRLSILNCYENELRELKLPSESKLSLLRCQNNQLTELDLTGSHLFPARYVNMENLSPQNTSILVSAVKTRTAIAIKCHSNTGNVANYGNYEAETIDGANYIILTPTGSTGDKDWYHQTVSYSYSTGFESETEAMNLKLQTMEVTITTSPYVMYVNPKAKIGSNYYGTLYLDYDAKVPEGAKVYYASDITADEELVMTEIPADKAIPARTAIYVEGEDGPGYYAFYEASTQDELAIIGTNYLTGTLTGASVEARKALTLGHDKSSGKLGFWNYSGTSIPAHRAYVTAETLSAAGGAKGLRLRFEDSSATGVRGVVAGSSSNGDGDYYSVQGVRVDKGQLKKGVYIVNGHKVVVK